MRHLEPLPDAPPDDLGLPEMAFLLADTVLVFDHLKHTITVVANAFVEGRDIDGPYERAVARIADVKARPLPRPLVAGGVGDSAERPAGRRRALGADPSARSTSSMTREEYEAGVERIREYIYAGDAFQVVLSSGSARPIDVSSFTVYRGLRAVNPSPYMYYIAFDDFALCGSSPEPLVTVQRRATSRPGRSPARARAAPTAAEDRQLIADLRADEKERAEHLMLVDLGRNDLGRVCVPGTVTRRRVHGHGARTRTSSTWSPTSAARCAKG